MAYCMYNSTARGAYCLPSPTAAVMRFPSGSVGAAGRLRRFCCLRTRCLMSAEARAQLTEFWIGSAVSFGDIHVLQHLSLTPIRVRWHLTRRCLSDFRCCVGTTVHVSVLQDHRFSSMFTTTKACRYGRLYPQVNTVLGCKVDVGLE